MITAVLQSLIFGTATNDSSLCVCACARVCMWAAILNTATRDDSNAHTSFEFQKHPRGTAATQQQQQRYTTGEPRKAHIHRNACVLPLQLATLPGFQVNHISKGNLATRDTPVRELRFSTPRKWSNPIVCHGDRQDKKKGTLAV